MAAAYGMHLDDDQAREIVTEWREANPWATDYWPRLWQAFLDAMENPGTEYDVGPVTYIFLKDYLGGTMLCRLPSGRFLTYRKVKWERIEETDDDGAIINSKWELTFARSYGRIKLWPGFLSQRDAGNRRRRAARHAGAARPDALVPARPGAHSR